tara:strand:- start:1021 stop:1374 length:354 start_codon:yes stop_codon:yes gene_type:complete
MDVLPDSGMMCRAACPIEVFRIKQASTGHEVATAVSLIDEGECFMILHVEEVHEVPQVQLDIMYKSAKYFLNISPAGCMMDENGEGGQYSFPFEAVDIRTDRYVQGGDTRTCLESES